MRNTLAICMFAVAFLAGCSTTPEASPQSDADAKRFETAARASIIYLYRADLWGGVSTIWIDDRLIGQSVAGTYFRVSVRPGRHRIAVSGSDQGRIVIETTEDSVHFVEMRVYGDSEGAYTTIFRSVSPELGKSTIAKCCGLLENWRPGQSRFPLFGL